MAFDQRNDAHRIGGGVGGIGGGGSAGISRPDVEDELVGAAMQISQMRQEAKELRKALTTSQAECARLDVALATETRRADNMKEAAAAAAAAVARPQLDTSRQNSLQAALTAKTLEVENLKAEIEQLQSKARQNASSLKDREDELEDVKKFEQDAAETAKKTLEELEKSTAEIARLQQLLLQQSQQPTSLIAGTVNATPATGTLSALGNGGGAVARSGGAIRGRSTYGMEDDSGEEDESKGAIVGKMGKGEDKNKKEDSDFDCDSEDEDEDNATNRRRGSGFFGWITGSGRPKRRRGE